MAAGVRSEPYSRDILRLAADLPDLGQLANPDASVELRSPTCGSLIRLEIMVEQGTVSAILVEIEGCAFAQASASLMIQSAEGKGVDQAKLALAETIAWLENTGPMPVWPDMTALEPVRERRGRHGAVLLPLRALVAALEEAAR